MTSQRRECLQFIFTQHLRNSVVHHGSVGCVCVCVGSEDGWGGRAGSETGKWAGAQPEEPLMYKKVFRLFLK